MKAEIKTAYAYSRKSRVYIAAAYVEETCHPGLPKSHSFKVLCNYAIGDTRAEAEQEAISRLKNGNERHPKDMPVRQLGRMPEALVTAYLF